MQVPDPIAFEPHPASLVDNVSAIPASPGIYSLSTVGNPPHIGRAINLKRRLTRLLVPSYTAESGALSAFTAKIGVISYWKVSSRLESSLILYELVRQSFPDSYLHRLHLRMPWFIGLTQTDSFARLQVSNKLGRLRAARFGPFRTREAAELYEESVSGLFQLRRCKETLAPSPDHPGCIYGEMNQCLRPCQCAVSAPEYASESERVAGFLETSGKSAIQTLAATRDRAAAGLDFEQAAFAHKRIEKLQAAASARDAVIGSVERFNGVALTFAEQDSVYLWPVVAGYWQLPLNIKPQAETRSLDSLLRDRLQAALATPSSSGNRLEHLALFSRWYYSSWCDGAWFPFETLAQLNYRKLVRGISHLLKPDSKNL